MPEMINQAKSVINYLCEEEYTSQGLLQQTTSLFSLLLCYPIPVKPGSENMNQFPGQMLQMLYMHQQDTD